ncbi:LysR family transcriptional regulator [Paludibacterium purpuratum]|uniref:LysR family transcriptional regulator n=1 Tax=Paludibacterium purpuratum TaxID=1144873 RepID=A0A4R7AVY4_9NEIS|nr:LysR family transcriptional regulator [Paludibacterium purpuratum]TDR71094.1 LysR family transcriptional regulator [Paludibacterium purpuratum]
MPSIEALRIFVEAAVHGSFSEAARRLHKSQSTVSASIANLEIDLGVALFDRHARLPVLTGAGQHLLANAEQVLTAQDRLLRAAAGLASGYEPRLSIALSDTYQPDRLEALQAEFDARYPEIELECLIAECADLLALIESGRAQLGFVERQPDYPPGLAYAPAAEPSAMDVYVSRRHPLAQRSHVELAQLDDYRALRLTTVQQQTPQRPRGHSWSAPSYLMLMEMAQGGFGWAELPCWLVERYGAESLQRLPLAGWPRLVTVDVVWSRDRPPGPAGVWLQTRMTGP